MENNNTMNTNDAMNLTNAMNSTNTVNQNIQTGEWGNPIPVSNEQLYGMYAPDMQSSTANQQNLPMNQQNFSAIQQSFPMSQQNYSKGPQTIPPDPLAMQYPAAIEQSILSSSSSAFIPETLTDSIYTPAFLASQVGKTMRIEFLVDGQLIAKTGELIGVGASYVLIRSRETGAVIMGDLYSIRFAYIYEKGK